MVNISEMTMKQLKITDYFFWHKTRNKFIKLLVGKKCLNSSCDFF